MIMIFVCSVQICHTSALQNVEPQIGVNAVKISEYEIKFCPAF